MSDAGHMTKRIEETHAGAWHKLAGISGSISLILPVLSEFEGVGEEIMMGIGGTSLVAVFGVLMKIGKVTSAVQGIAEEVGRSSCGGGTEIEAHRLSLLSPKF